MILSFTRYLKWNINVISDFRVEFVLKWSRKLYKSVIEVVRNSIENCKIINEGNLVWSNVNDMLLNLCRNLKHSVFEMEGVIDNQLFLNYYSNTRCHAIWLYHINMCIRCGCVSGLKMLTQIAHHVYKMHPKQSMATVRLSRHLWDMSPYRHKLYCLNKHRKLKNKKLIPFSSLSQLVSLYHKFDKACHCVVWNFSQYTYSQHRMLTLQVNPCLLLYLE